MRRNVLVILAVLVAVPLVATRVQSRRANGG